MSPRPDRPLSSLYADATDLAAHYALRLLPVSAVTMVGAWLGRRFGPRRVLADAQLRRNLRRLRPDIVDPDEFEAAVRRHWENAGRCYAEFSALGRIYGSDRVAIEGTEHLVAARAAGRAQIWMFLHLGNWEVIGPKLVDLGFGENGLQVWQPPLSPVRRRLAERVRRRYAAHLVDASRSGAMGIVRRLQAGGVVSIAVDECVQGEVFAPAFGRKLRLDGNLARVARLAAMTDALVLLIYAVRRPSAHFTVRVSPPIDLASAEGRPDETLALLNGAVEPIVLWNIDQWFWLDNLNLDAIDLAAPPPSSPAPPPAGATGGRPASPGSAAPA